MELGKVLDKVVEGDLLITTEISRITGSNKQLCESIEKHLKLAIRGFIIDGRKEELDVMTNVMLKMMGVFAKVQHNVLSKCMKSGMVNAVAKGKGVGRPTTNIGGLPDSFIRHYQKYKSKQINKMELARLYGMSRQSIHKYIGIMII